MPNQTSSPKQTKNINETPFELYFLALKALKYQLIVGKISSEI